LPTSPPLLTPSAAAGLTDVRVFARSGNDRVDLSTLGVATFVNAGGGDDEVTGGIGDDLLIGRGGADTLTGGGGDDFLIGGSGSDRLVGSSGADVLAAGDVAGDVSLAGLRETARQWAVAHAESADMEAAGEDAVIVHENVDVLTGASGADWFIVGTGAKITDLKKTTNEQGDLVTVIA
jgi:Ca2+-binding RTX toxin-like protein